VDDLGRVALRIDGDEIGPDVLALVAQCLQPAVELEQGRGADFRTMGEAEEDGARMPLEGLLGDRLAIALNQFKRRAKGLGSMLYAIPVERHIANGKRHDDEYADKDRSHHGEAPLSGMVPVRQKHQDRPDSTSAMKIAGACSIHPAKATPAKAESATARTASAAGRARLAVKPVMEP